MALRWARIAAAPLAWLYGGAVAVRGRLYDRGRLPVRRLAAPVLSVGNLVVGGSGKTPLVGALARRLLDRGLPVAVLARGYRRAEGSGFCLVADGRRRLAGADRGGDEAAELARSVPGLVVAVGADRYAAGLEVLRRLGPHVFLLDDGFQHRRLARDLDLVLMDAGEREDDLRLLPAGRLREGLAALGRAEAFCWTRVGPGRPAPALAARVEAALAPGAPILRARIAPVRLRRVGGLARGEALDEVGSLAGRPVALLAAIARPERLVEDVRGTGARIVAARFRRDHHRWSAAELEAFLAEARAAGAERIVTTGKDAEKIEGALGPGSAPPVDCLELAVSFEDEAAVDALLDRLAASFRPAGPAGAAPSDVDRSAHSL